MYTRVSLEIEIKIKLTHYCFQKKKKNEEEKKSVESFAKVFDQND